jgi:hypothetical protein
MGCCRFKSCCPDHPPTHRYGAASPQEVGLVGGRRAEALAETDFA